MLLTAVAATTFLTGDAGLDVFHFANGYGADTVTDFTPGTDKLDLTGMGLTSASQALAFASQVGSDTVFNFGAGDTITLQNVSKAALTSAEIVTSGFPRGNARIRRVRRLECRRRLEQR